MMKWSYHMKIGRKLICAHIFSGGMTGAMGFIGIPNLRNVAGPPANMDSVDFEGLMYIKELNGDLLHGLRAEKNLRRRGRASGGPAGFLRQADRESKTGV
jgi:hypothetical protein